MDEARSISERQPPGSPGEGRFRAIVSALAEMVCLARPDGTLVYVNGACARQFGFEPGALAGRGLYDFVAAEDREMVRAQIAAVMGTGARSEVENRMLCAEGSQRWVAWTHSIHRQAGQAALLLSVGHDITERKQAERALRASQTFLERTGRVAGVGGWELDLLDGSLTWSDQTRRIHEVDADFVPTLDNAISFYAPQARPLIEAAVQRGATDGEPWDLELPLITAKGRSIWVRSVGEVEFDGSRPVRLFGAFQDITTRRGLEHKLAQSEGFLRQLADSLPLRIAYLDRDRRYRFVNQELLRHFGRERSDVIGRTRAELMPDADDEVVGARARAALAGQAQQFEFDELVDGAMRRFENRLVPDRAESGEVRGFFVTGIDITERSAAQRELQALTTIFDNTPDYVVQTDARGGITYMNAAVRRALGMTADESVAGRSFVDFNTPETNRLFSEVVLPALEHAPAWLGEASVYVAGRREVPVSYMVIAHRDGSGRIERYSAVMRDISGALAAKMELLRQTRTLVSVAESIPATVVVIGSDRRYRFVNRAFELWCGLPREQIIGRTTAEVLGEQELERRLPWVERALAGETVTFELDYPGPERTTYLALTIVPLRLDSGELDSFVGVTQDITQHKLEEGRLLELAQRDPLTGLLNRAGLEHALALGQQAAHPHSLAVLYIDLDHFKPVNDRYGHPAGDRVLQLFAERLTRLVRPTDAVARLGGDEFAIALFGVREIANAQTVAAKVLAAAQMPFQVAEISLQIGASVGVAFGTEPQGWRELIARADAQLLRAKAAGRGRQAAAER